MNISPAPANPFGCGRIRRHLAAAFLVAAGLVLSLVAAPPASAASEGTLVLQHDGWGRGFVTSNPAGINCIANSVKPSEGDSGYGEVRQSGTCSLRLPVGTVVTLTETAEVGSYFNYWLGPTSSGDDTTFRVTVGGPGYNTVGFVFCPDNETCFAPL